MNAGISELEPTRLWVRTHKSLDTKSQKFEHEGKKAWKSCNVQFSGYDLTKIWAWEHEIVVNARKSEHERKEISWTHKSLDLNA